MSDRGQVTGATSFFLTNSVRIGQMNQVVFVCVKVSPAWERQGPIW